MDLIVESPSDYSDWITGLMYLVSNNPNKIKNNPNRKPTISAQLEEAFKKADKNGKGTLSYSDVIQFLHALNLGIDARQVLSFLSFSIFLFILFTFFFSK